MSVSVVVTGYNQADLIGETLASIAAQTYRDFEVVMVDDGSTDGTVDVMRAAFHSMPGSVGLLVRENGGMASARNTGIGASHGDLVLPVDGDDQIDPVYLERTVAAFEAHPDVSVVFTDTRVFGAANAIWRNGPWGLREIAAHNRIPSTSLFRRSLWEQVGGYCSLVSSFCDWDFWLKAVERGATAYHVEEPLWYYRRHAASFTGGLSPVERNRLNGLIRDRHPLPFGLVPA